MDLKIANVTVNTARPRELAEWWAEALGGTITVDYGEYVMVGAGDGTGVAFQFVEGTKPGRVHVDLVTSDAGHQIGRLLKAGARHVADHDAPGGAFQWTVLADPDGNEFCVTQGH